MKQARLKVVNISSLSWVFMIFRNLVTLRPRKYPLPSQGYCQFCHTVQPWKTERNQKFERKDDVTFFLFSHKWQDNDSFIQRGVFNGCARKFLFIYEVTIPSLETTQCLVIHYVCKCNENKPRKFLSRAPLGANVFDVRLIYAQTRTRSLFSFTE